MNDERRERASLSPEDVENQLSVGRSIYRKLDGTPFVLLTISSYGSVDIQGREARLQGVETIHMPVDPDTLGWLIDQLKSANKELWEVVSRDVDEKYSKIERRTE